MKFMFKVILLALMPLFLMAASYPMPAPFTSNHVMVSNGTKWIDQVLANAQMATMSSSSSTVGTVKGNMSGSSAVPSDLVCTSANTNSSIVFRDGSGGFSCGAIIASGAFTAMPLNTATNSNNYSSNAFNLDSSYWTGSISAFDTWTWQAVLGAGSNPYSIMNLAHSGTPGLNTVYMPALDNTPIGIINPVAAGFSTVSVNNVITSTLSTGTAPFTIASTTKVNNLYVARAALGDTVTTNANLTGDVTSSGNATSYAVTVPLNKGGTGQTTKAPAFDALQPMTTGGDIIYGGASGTGTRLANGTNGQVLTSSGTTVAPTWTTISGVLSGLTQYGVMVAASSTTAATIAPDASTSKWLQSGGSSANPTWSTFTAPTFQSFNSTGTQVGWLFTISSGNATAGATYTNNGNTYTVQITTSSYTQVFMSGTGATSGGTLTKATGTGDSTLTFSAKTATALYTAHTNPTPLFIKIRSVGGGGGGAGSGSASAGAGGVGGTTYFGFSVDAAGGAGGSQQGGQSAGGICSLSGATGPTLVGGYGGGSDFNGVALEYATGGDGGNAPQYGGGAPRSSAGAAGNDGLANTGGGASGGNAGATVSVYGGGGGASGGVCDWVIMTSGFTTMPYQIAAGGTLGGAGTSGSAGGTGGTGKLEIWEYYQ